MPSAFLLASGDKHKKQRKSLADCKAGYQLNTYTLYQTNITTFHSVFIVASFCFPLFFMFIARWRFSGRSEATHQFYDRCGRQRACSLKYTSVIKRISRRLEKRRRVFCRFSSKKSFPIIYIIPICELYRLNILMY